MILTAENSACDFQRIGLEQTEQDWKVFNNSLKVLTCVTVWAHQRGNQSPKYFFFSVRNHGILHQ